MTLVKSENDSSHPKHKDDAQDAEADNDPAHFSSALLVDVFGVFQVRLRLLQIVFSFYQV